MLAKNFDHREFEQKIRLRWERGNFFETKKYSTASGTLPGSYAIVLPPPNVTGSLHVGHALNHTLQDVLIRYHRMCGFATLWQPGTDHAGIATQMMVERHLEEQGIKRKEIGREKFIEHVWDWKAEYGDRIINQQQRLGESCDWSRSRFTMDKGLSTAVTKVFVTLHRQNLIYRDKRLVNWDPKFQTALSDLEVEGKTLVGKLYHIRYPYVDGDGDGIVVATTRPETLFGDMAVAVHPEDERYQAHIGKSCRLPLSGREIPIIADRHADPGQGSGAVKITPAHDFHDFEVGKRHGLECLSVMDKHAHLNDAVPKEFRGLERFAAREKLIAALEAENLLVLIEEHEHTVPYGDRSKIPLEPLLTDQWYLNAQFMAKPALEAVEDGRITIIPDSERNRYFSWMRDIQPWCISRQLWWGHRVPAWYGPDGEIFVGETQEEVEAEARIHYDKPVRLEQDTDVLDTWFSSALWPFSTLDWPEETPEYLRRYYPTNVLVTGADILFFWVARMIMMGLHFMGEVPFHTVLLHGLVRDGQGRKMSKTIGNVVDPLELCDEKGADSLRFTLCALTAQGRDTKLSDQRLEGYRNFITKLWNASRFLERFGAKLDSDASAPRPQAACNQWMLLQLSLAIAESDKAIAEYRFNDYAAALYRLVWNRFCDWYIELIKPILNDDTHPMHQETLSCAEFCLMSCLKLLHPITPYITEELYSALSPVDDERMLVAASWPRGEDIGEIEGEQTRQIQWLIELIGTVRSMKVSMDIAPASETALNLADFDATEQAFLKEYAGALRTLAHLEIAHQNFPNTVRFPMLGKIVHLYLAENVDFVAIKSRLHKEIAKTQKQSQQLRGRLDNPQFIANAPEDVLEESRLRIGELETNLAQYQSLLSAMVD